MAGKSSKSSKGSKSCDPLILYYAVLFAAVFAAIIFLP